MAEHNDLGKKGEDIAAEYLLKAGYKILHRNWTFLKGELDIVAIQNNMLVIVEVKTRSIYYHADTEDLISNKKLKQLYEAADRYMELYQIDNEVRYDLIVVVFHGDTWTIEHIDEAFYPFMNIP